MLLSNSSQQFIVSPDEYLQISSSCAETSFTVLRSVCAVLSLAAIMNPNTEDSSESLATSHQNIIITVTDVIIMQEVDTTFVIQSSSNRNDGISEIWIYILVAVLAVFLIIIVVLTIFVLRLILMVKKSQTTNNIDRKLQHACIMKGIIKLSTLAMQHVNQEHNVCV